MSGKREKNTFLTNMKNYKYKILEVEHGGDIFHFIKYMNRLIHINYSRTEAIDVAVEVSPYKVIIATYEN